MDFERNKKIFTKDTIAVYHEINGEVDAMLMNQDALDMLDCAIYSSDCIADVVVDSIDLTKKQVICNVYVTKDFEEYTRREYISIPLEWFTQEGALDKALAQRKAEWAEKERRRSELEKDERYQEYLRLKEHFKDL